MEADRARMVPSTRSRSRSRIEGTTTVPIHGSVVRGGFGFGNDGNGGGGSGVARSTHAGSDREARKSRDRTASQSVGP